MLAYDRRQEKSKEEEFTKRFTDAIEDKSKLKSLLSDVIAYMKTDSTPTHRQHLEKLVADIVFVFGKAEITRVQSGQDALLDIYCGDRLFQLCIRPTIFMQYDGQSYPINMQAFQEHRCVFGDFELVGDVYFKIVMYVLNNLNSSPYHKFVRLTSGATPFLAVVIIDVLPNVTVISRYAKFKGQCIENDPEVFPFWSNYQIRIGDQVFDMLPVSPREKIPEATDALWSYTRYVRTDFTKMPTRLFSRLRLMY